MAHCPAECKCPGHWGWNKLVLIKKKKKIGLKGADTFRIRTSEKPYKKIVVIKLARFLRSLKDT